MGNISEMSKGGTTVAARPLKAHFLFFFRFFLYWPLGLATNRQTSQVMNGRAPRKHRRKVREKAGRPWEDAPAGRGRKCHRGEKPPHRGPKTYVPEGPKDSSAGCDRKGGIWPRMAEGPSSTAGQLPIRWRNPIPVRPMEWATGATSQI